MTERENIQFMPATAISNSAQSGRGLNIVLWIIQALLAAFFIFGGVFKLIGPIEEAATQTHMPVLFLRFIGLCETLGALGLILPGMLRIKRMLTPLAAIGLMIITIGATVVTLALGQGAMAAFPFVTALVCAFIAYGRRSYFSA